MAEQFLGCQRRVKAAAAEQNVLSIALQYARKAIITIRPRCKKFCDSAY
jgi:hypothetical protein